jgi:cellulose synthase/poly-beta-1,6-N-acetylglucosamine synthase-like glycosyltransferase
MMVIDIVLAAGMVIYGILIIVLTYALIRYRPPQTETELFVSVLIAARNEAAVIADCIECLANQTYSQDQYEVILINDRSTDETKIIAERYKDKIKHFKIIDITELSSALAPKKNALNEGVKSSRGGIILCTDADCRPKRNWIKSMISCFNEKTGMVVGFSPIIPVNRFSVLDRFVALDSLALAVLAAASSYWNKTLTATGRSLAYRKSVFNELGGFSKIGHFISGDDDLLLGLVRNTNWKIAYCMDPGSQVDTNPPKGIRRFINQKVRQSSKSRHYNISKISLMASLYVFHLLLVLYTPLTAAFKTFSSLVNSLEILLWVFWPWLLKISLDFIIILTGAIRFNRMKFLPFYPVIAILHPFYIVVFGIWGLFGKFTWKEDQFSNKL